MEQKIQVKIFKPSVSSMQSALQKGQWIMEGRMMDHKQSKNEIVGWVSSEDMSRQIRMIFQTKESAIKYADRNFLKYQIIDPVLQKFEKKSYAQNFTKKSYQHNTRSFIG